jgi:hypothetical protein
MHAGNITRMRVTLQLCTVGQVDCRGAAVGAWKADYERVECMGTSELVRS